jgi:hypothetical protein
MVYRPDTRASSTNRPTTKASKSISALPPQLGTMLIWPVTSSVTRPLLSHGLMVRQHPQNTLVRSLVHASRLNRHSAARSPFEPSTQLLDTTRRDSVRMLGQCDGKPSILPVSPTCLPNGQGSARLEAVAQQAEEQEPQRNHAG